MCKVGIITGINQKNKNIVGNMVYSLATKMSFGNNQGFGHSSVYRGGGVYTEKWMDNVDRFKNLDDPTAFQKLQIGPGHDEGATPGTIIMHARYATVGPQAIQNTHPFVDVEAKTTLIHNGGISNHGELTKKTSQCDSEVILNEYVKNKVNENETEITEVIEKLRGWWACAVLSFNRQVPILDIFVNHASLFKCEIGATGLTLFSTSEHDIKKVCEEQSLDYFDPKKVDQGVLYRYNAITGNLISEYVYMKSASAGVKSA